MKKILLTGGTGYIGSELTKKLLEENYSVGIIKRKSSKTELIKGIYNKLAVFDYEKDYSSINNALFSFKPDIVIHLASYQVYDHKLEDISKIIDGNIALGLFLLESMKQNKIKYFINTESFWQNYNNELFNPVCLYAASKKSFIDLLKYYTEIKLIKAISLKLYDTCGPNDPREKVFSSIKKALKNNDDNLDMTPGNQLINMVHIRDVTNGYIIAIRRLIKNSGLKLEEFDIRHSKSIRLKDIVCQYLKETNSNLKINWGGKEYKEREVMVPYDKGSILPAWSPQIPIDCALKEII